MDNYRDIAHDIRTPLAVIRTNTEVALMNPRLSDELRETLTLTIQQLDQISETITKLLTQQSEE
jgi:signal transduction histidine kinase